jgi:hypothetical protein
MDIVIDAIFTLFLAFGKIQNPSPGSYIGVKTLVMRGGVASSDENGFKPLE